MFWIHAKHFHWHSCVIWEDHLLQVCPVLHGISEEAESAHIPWHHKGFWITHIQGTRIYILALSASAKIIFTLFQGYPISQGSKNCYLEVSATKMFIQC